MKILTQSSNTASFVVIRIGMQYTLTKQCVHGPMLYKLRTTAKNNVISAKTWMTVMQLSCSSNQWLLRWMTVSGELLLESNRNKAIIS